MKSGDTLQLRTLHNYDENNRLVDQYWKLSGSTYREQFNYDGIAQGTVLCVEEIRTILL